MEKDNKIKLLDRANIECNWGNPNTQFIDQPEWAQIITPNTKHSSANCVFRSRIIPSDVESKVSQTIKFYENMDVPYRWLVTPLTEPSSFAEILMSKGLCLLYEATAMISSVNDQIKPISSGISVVRVNLDTVDIYIETFVKSWSLPSHQVEEFKNDTYYGLKHGNNRFIPFVAYFHGEPVGTSALLNLSSGGYLAAGTVDSKYRGQGIYKAMVSHRAEFAKSLGQTNLLIHAKKFTAAPICKKLNFEEVYDYQVFSKEKLIGI